MSGPPSDPYGGGSAWGLTTHAPEDDGDTFVIPEADRYRSGGQLGVGGMGVVDAVHDARLDRDVARKTLTLQGDQGAVALLVHEARITARLDHPNIVPVHDAGRGPDGRWYFTMRLIRGRTLEAMLADRADADLATWLRYLLDACRALAHAHDVGIVHADLKPSNILVGPHGEVQVTDWGLARFLDPAAPASPVPPDSGTPPWRAPEVGAQQPPTPASDVYALGMVLRQILAGSPQREPTGAPVDLVAVMHRATQAEPAQRYPDAAALAAELTRWLDGRPVRAHAYTPWQLLSRVVRAWRAPLAVATVAVVWSLAALLWSGAQTAAERDRALAAEATLRDTANTLWTSRAAAALVRDDRPEATRAAREALALGPSPAARGVLAAFGTAPAAVRTATHPLPPCTDLRLGARGTLCMDGAALHQVRGDGSITHTWDLPATDAIWLPDGTLAALAQGGMVHLDPTTGATDTWTPVAAARGLIGRGPGAYVDRLSLTLLEGARPTLTPCDPRDNLDVATRSPDGAWWTVCSHGRVVRGDGRGAWTTLAEHGPALSTPSALDLDPTHDRLVAGTVHGEIVTLDARTGAILTRLTPGLSVLRTLSVAPDGIHALALDQRGQVVLWRVADGVSLGRLDTAGVRDLRWTGATTFELAREHRELWSLAAAPAPYRWSEAGGISAMAVSEDGSLLAVATGPELVVRHLPDAQVVYRGTPSALAIKAILFHDDGHTVFTGSVDLDDAMVATDLRTGVQHPVFPDVPRVRRLVPLGADQAIAAIYAPVLWRVELSTGSAHRLGTEATVTDLARAPGSALAWALDEAGGVLRITPEGITGLPTRQPPGANQIAALPADEALVIAHGHTVRVVDAATGTTQHAWTVAGEITALAVHPAGTTAAIGTLDGQVIQLSLADGRIMATAPGHSDRVSQLLVLADGDLMSAGWDAQVRRWTHAVP